VPDLVGLGVRRRRTSGTPRQWVVVTADVDGRPLGALAWPGPFLVTGRLSLPAARVEMRRTGWSSPGRAAPAYRSGA